MNADPTTFEPENHWNDVYDQRGDTAVSWFQPRAEYSLQLLERMEIAPGAGVIDVGGGSSRLVDGLLERGFADVTVLDVSESALASARERVGADAHVTWLCHDVLDWHPSRRFQVWHDRALFHFLTGAADRARYLAVLDSALAPGGAVVIATFAADGPQQCSGLPVRRYGAQELAETLGSRFRLLHTGRQEHTTPAGVVQPFTWVVGRYA